MSETKLLPCPFCGNLKTLYRNPIYGKFQEYCDECKARGPERDGLNDATVAWNTRPAPALTPKQEAAEDLYEALEDAEGLVIAWAAHYAMQSCTTDAEYSKATSIEGWHPTHQAIYDKLKAALAKAGRA